MALSDSSACRYSLNVHDGLTATTPITAQGCHAVENPDSHPNTIGHSVVDVGNCTQLKFHFVRVRRGYTQLLFELDPETGYPVPQLSTKTLVSVSNCSFGQGMPLQDANGLRIIVRENEVQLIGQRNASKDPFETVPPRVITVWCFVSPHVTFISPNIGNGNPVEHAAALPHRQPLEYWATRDRSLSTSSSSQLHDELFVMVAEIESPAMWQMQLMQHSQYVSQFDALLGGFPPGFGENGADIYFGQYGYTSGRTPWLSQLIAPSPDRPPSDQAMLSKNLHALVLALVTNPGAVNCRQRYLRQLIRAVEMFNATVDSFGEVLPHNTPPPNFPHRGDYLEGQEFVTKYLFVWAVENSNCKGYITEKVQRPLLAGAVPLVFAPRVDGDPVPNYDTIAPRGSYINIADFADPVELAAYLVHLRDNPAEYLKYHAHVGARPDDESLRRIMPSHERPWQFDIDGEMASCPDQLGHVFHQLGGRRRPLDTNWGCLEIWNGPCEQGNVRIIDKYKKWPHNDVDVKDASNPYPLSSFSGCRLKANIDLYGGDIEGANPVRDGARTLFQCAATCRAHELCRAFSFNVHLGCFLKSTTALQHKNSYGETLSGVCT